MTDFEIDKVVKIEGTDYDRRRKLSTKDVAKIQRDYKKGKSITQLSLKYNVAYGTIHYHVDKVFKENIKKKRNRYAASAQNPVAQRISRVAHKRAILAGNI